MGTTGANRVAEAAKERKQFEFAILCTVALFVALIVGWLGVNITTVRERRAAWEDLKASGVAWESGISGPVELFHAADDSFDLSWTRILCGDVTYYGVLYFPHRPATKSDVEAASLFPELDAFIDAPDAHTE